MTSRAVVRLIVKNRWGSSPLDGTLPPPASSRRPPRSPAGTGAVPIHRENREQHLEFLQSLIRAQPRGRSRSGGGGRTVRGAGPGGGNAQALPTKLSLNLEFAAEETIDRTERISVVGRLRGTGSGKSLLFFGHPDGEPMTEESLAGWEHDPFAAEVDDGRIYGWGAADDLTGVAIMAEAVAAVLETVGTPRR